MCGDDLHISNTGVRNISLVLHAPLVFVGQFFITGLVGQSRINSMDKQGNTGKKTVVTQNWTHSIWPDREKFLMSMSEYELRSQDDFFLS